MPLALVLQHAPIEHLGSAEPVFRARGYDIRAVDATTADLAAIDPDEADVLVTLGGPMGVYEKERHPFIAGELSLLRARLANSRPTLGICLGAQLVAEALGATVRRGDTVEIGFRSVTPTEEGTRSPLRHLTGLPVMQWHGDTFDLPPGATRLASSAEYENEAYGVGRHVLGLQFHPEISGVMFDEWIAAGADELSELGIDPAEVRADADRHGAVMDAASALLFDEWLARLP